MGNDMFNDEQLAHAEILQKETEDALGFWKDRALKAEAALSALSRARETDGAVREAAFAVVKDTSKTATPALRPMSEAPPCREAGLSMSHFSPAGTTSTDQRTSEVDGMAKPLAMPWCSAACNAPSHAASVDTSAIVRAG